MGKEDGCKFPPGDVKAGDTISIWEWRFDKYLEVEVAEIDFDDDSDSWIANIIYPNGDYHYAYYIPEQTRWESGDI